MCLCSAKEKRASNRARIVFEPLIVPDLETGTIFSCLREKKNEIYTQQKCPIFSYTTFFLFFQPFSQLSAFSCAEFLSLSLSLSLSLFIFPLFFYPCPLLALIVTFAFLTRGRALYFSFNLCMPGPYANETGD